MSNERHKARLKHAAEVLGWLAEGKTLQARKPVVGADWDDVPPDEEEPWDEQHVVGSILAGLWEYRVKPEPVEFTASVSTWSGRMVIFADGEGLEVGDRVTVTKQEP